MERPAVPFELFDRAFPYHFVLDTELRFVGWGPRFGALAEDLAPGDAFERRVRIERPETRADFMSLRDRRDDVFLLEILESTGLRLRGQMFSVRLDGADRLVFLGHPWLTDIAELAGLGLDLGDFPPHAGLADLLVLLQARDAGLEEMRGLASRLRRTADELEERNRMLERELRERNRLEEQLRQAQKMDTIGRLAGGVAHDFNNILMAITGHASLALAQADDSQASDHVKAILDSAKSAADLTARLLAFSRQQVLRPTYVEPGKAITEIGAMLAPIIEGVVELRVDATPVDATVLVDRSGLQQVIMNLAINARDAMPEGGTITVRSRLIELDRAEAVLTGDIPAGRWVVFEISDQGTGIAEDDRARLFEPFFTTKDTGEGTGLGLSTVWWIVQRSKGWIDVRTWPDAGSIFRVFLPAHPLEAPRTDVEDDESLGQLRGTILLVEDDPDVRGVVRDELRLDGFAVVDAEGPMQALAILENNGKDFDLLLTDYMMPGMNGGTLARRVRDRWPDMRVVIMSGADRGVICESEDFIATGSTFLQKPFSPESLLRVIVRALKVHAPARTP